MEKIYIVLTHTGTVLSRTIKIFTNNTYTHVSISLDENMEEMYSFGRLNPYNPFIAGFVKEGIHIGTFKRFKNTKTSIFSLEIKEDEYKKLEEILSKFIENKKIYKFNFLGLVLAGINKRYKRKNKFYCSEFVRDVLEKSQIKQNEISNILKPEDFKNLSSLQLEYEGLLRMYKLKECIKI